LFSDFKDFQQIYSFKRRRKGMKKILVLVMGLLWSATAVSAVSLRICEADGNTPLDSNTPVMVGTKLTLICSSNAPVKYAALGLVIADANQGFGRLFARGPHSVADWTQSHFPAAGSGAQVIETPTDELGNPVNEFDMYAAKAGGAQDGPAQGDWFVIDYNATDIGACTVKFYIYQMVDVNGSEIINPFTNPQMRPVTFTHVASRDFNFDGRVDFSDFAKLASYWLSVNCGAINNNCEGTDLNPVPDGKIDFVDVMYFAEYWLGHKSATETFIASAQGGGNQQQSLIMDGGTDFQLAESALLTQQSIGEEPQTMMQSQLPAIYLVCDNNSPDPNTEVTVWVHSDAPLFCMGMGIQVFGDATITDAMKTADCSKFGWDPDWNSDPYIDANEGWAFIGGVIWAADAKGTVGYFKLRYNSGQISVSIYDEWSDAFGWDGQSCTEVPFSQDVLFIGRDRNEP
jgi:hypothetical protein